MENKSWGGQNRLDRFDNEIESRGGVPTNFQVKATIHTSLNKGSDSKDFLVFDSAAFL